MLIRAAGAVAWRPGPDGDEVLLVHRAKYDDWSLPKGKQDPDEPLPVTAAREVLEEAGATIALGRHLAPVRYKVNGNPKQVDYWAAQVIEVDETAVPNSEVDEVAWLPVADALTRVSYKQDLTVLSDYADGPPDTVPLILLRHAKALARSDWKRADDDRPLDKAGASDALTLAGMLSCFAPQATVITSPAVRCVDTIRPYVAQTDSPVVASDALRAGPAAGPGPAAAQVFSLIAARGPAIVCAHRENLPGLLGAAVGFLDGKSVPDKIARPLAKGAFLVLHMMGGTLVGIDRYELPD